MSRIRRMLPVLLSGSLVAVGLLMVRPSVQAEPTKEEDAALKRTRKQVRMLDDIYKSAIVLITEHYVTEESDLAAGDAFQALFNSMKEKGWHEIRLLDATGEPYDDDNSPKDAFEKSAVKALKGGKEWHEEVITRDGKQLLRAATPLPVVMERCILCHDHYKDVPKGQPIGALSYTIAIE